MRQPEFLRQPSRARVRHRPQPAALQRLPDRRAAALATALLLLGAAAVSGAPSARAEPVTLTITGFSNGYALVDTSQTGVVPAGRLAGQITDGGQTESFLTYCVELSQSFSWNTPYAYSRAATGSTFGFSTLQAERLGRLYSRAGEQVDTTDESVAFQLAVWEITHEPSTNPLDLSSGVLRLDSGGSTAQRTLASNWLQGLDTQQLAWDAQRLYSSTRQDFVSFSRHVVPEPGSAALALLALSGLALCLRARQARPARQARQAR